MPTSLNHQPEVHHPKSPTIRWAADYPIYASNRCQIDAARRLSKGAHERPFASQQGLILERASRVRVGDKR